MAYTQEEREEWREKIMNLRESGHTYTDIASVLGKSRATIQRLAIPFEPKERKETKHISINAYEMKHLYHDQLMSGRKIAQQLDVSKRQVFDFMRKNRIERRGYSEAAKLATTSRTRKNPINRSQIFRATGQITNIYFLYAPSVNLVKIGRATYVKKRVMGVKTASPVPLRLLKVISDVDAIEENKLHNLFAKYRRHGEWFEVAGELATYLDEYINEKQVAM